MATLKVTNIKNESFAGDQLYLKTDGKLGTDIGHRFKYTSGEWVSDPAELPVV